MARANIANTPASAAAKRERVRGSSASMVARSINSINRISAL